LSHPKSPRSRRASARIKPNPTKSHLKLCCPSLCFEPQGKRPKSDSIQRNRAKTFSPLPDRTLTRKSNQIKN
jgi:hypothetical protein